LIGVGFKKTTGNCEFFLSDRGNKNGGNFVVIPVNIVSNITNAR